MVMGSAIMKAPAANMVNSYRELHQPLTPASKPEMRQHILRECNQSLVSTIANSVTFSVLNV